MNCVCGHSLTYHWNGGCEHHFKELHSQVEPYGVRVRFWHTRYGECGCTAFRAAGEKAA